MMGVQCWNMAAHMPMTREVGQGISTLQRCGIGPDGLLCCSWCDEQGDTFNSLGLFEILDAITIAPISHVLLYRCQITFGIHGYTKRSVRVGTAVLKNNLFIDTLRGANATSKELDKGTGSFGVLQP
jgi:hypothetical protein